MQGIFTMNVYIFLHKKGVKLWEGIFSKTLNNEYIERIHQMLYFSSLSDNGMLQIFSFLTK